MSEEINVAATADRAPHATAPHATASHVAVGFAGAAMSASTPSATYGELRWCGWCRTRLREVTQDAMWRTYQCTAGCRTKPVDADWFDAQVHRAIAGKVDFRWLHQAVERITLLDAVSSGVRVRWRCVFPARPQPSTSTPAPIRFVPVPASRR